VNASISLTLTKCIKVQILHVRNDWLELICS